MSAKVLNHTKIHFELKNVLEVDILTNVKSNEE